MSGTHSKLNLLVPKIHWLTHGSSFFLLPKCSPTVIICPGEVNMWAPGKSCQAWIAIVILWLPTWALCITEKGVWRTGQIAWEISANVLLRLYVKNSLLLLLLPTLSTQTSTEMSTVFIDCCHTQNGDSRANLDFSHKILGAARHRLEGKMHANVIEWCFAYCGLSLYVDWLKYTKVNTINTCLLPICLKVEFFFIFLSSCNISKH